MRDLYSTTVETAAVLAADEALPAEHDRDRYVPDDDRRRGPDPYTGKCSGCGEPVSKSSEGGSCLWRGGPWHPTCRVADKQAGGTWDTPPATTRRAA